MNTTDGRSKELLKNIIEKSSEFLFKLIHGSDVDTWKLARNVTKIYLEFEIPNSSDFDNVINEINQELEKMNSSGYFFLYKTKTKEYLLKLVKDLKYDIGKFFNERTFKEEFKEVLGKALLIFLADWNAVAFKEENIDDEWWRILGEVGDIVDKYKKFTDYTLSNINLEERKEDIKNFLMDLLNIVKKIRDKEDWVATFKIASVLFPKIFIPIDREIGEFLGYLKPQAKWRIDDYIQFLNIVKDLAGEVKEDRDLKKIDEFLWSLISKKTKLQKILRELLGNSVGIKENIKKLVSFDSFERNLEFKIKVCSGGKIRKIIIETNLIQDQSIHVSIFEQNGEIKKALDKFIGSDRKCGKNNEEEVRRPEPFTNGEEFLKGLREIINFFMFRENNDRGE